MTQYGFPFNSEMVDGVPDRPGNAESLASYLAAFFTDGILPHPAEALKVRVISGMNVNVSAGACVIDGHLFKSETSNTLELAAANSSMNRIDRVVVRLDHNRRLMELGVLTGTPASNPVAPTLTRNATVYEMCLAEITVVKGEASLAAGNITDTRGDSTLCGVSGMTAHQEIKAIGFSEFDWKYKVNDNGPSLNMISYNNSRFIQGLNLVIIDLRFAINDIPFAKNTFHELVMAPDEIKPKFLKALTAINGVNNERVYQAYIDTNGVIGLKVSHEITKHTYISIQGAYVLD